MCTRAALVHRLALAAPVVIALACGGITLPAPRKQLPPVTAYNEVPSPPPPPHVELIPKKPHGAAVWIDGSYDWTGTRWRWKEGGWFEPPPEGVFYSDWEIARPGGSRLLFASAGWRDHSGAKVPSPRLLVSATLAPNSAEADAGPAAAGPPSEEDAGGGSGNASGADGGESDASASVSGAVDGGNG